jgi:octaprenyl-diphosphate synthase
MHGGDSEKTAILTVVMQFIYLATRVHEALSGEESTLSIKGIGHFQDDRIAVLLGDYCYSRASVILIESGIKGMVRSVADMVCMIQEIRLNQSKMPNLDHKDTAELLAGCCALGAQLAGATVLEQERMGSFGRNLGMALGLSETGASQAQIACYIEQGKAALHHAPTGPERIILEQLIDMLPDSGAGIRLVG